MSESEMFIIYMMNTKKMRNDKREGDLSFFVFKMILLCVVSTD